MKVLLGHCFYRSSAPSGEDSVYRNEKALLQDNGIEVIPFEKHNDDIEGLNFIGNLNLARNTVWNNAASEEIKQLIIKAKPDLAHFHNTFPQMSQSVYKTCQALGVPVVQTLHNFRFVCASALLQRNGSPCEDCLGTNLIPAIKHKCYRGSLIATLPLVSNIVFNQLNGNLEKNVNKYISMTEFTRSRLVKGGLPENKFSVKPNFVTDPGEPSYTMGNYAIYVGRLTDEKGVRTLIDAWMFLPPEIRLVVVGDGELMPTLKQQVSLHNLNVEFVGYKKREDVFELIQNSRFLIVPSECYEGFPVAVVEAFAKGKLVVASAIGSLNEIVEEDKTGSKFTAANPQSLSSTIENLWYDEEKILRLSHHARETYLAKFTAEQNFKQLISIYNDCLEEKNSY